MLNWEDNRKLTDLLPEKEAKTIRTTLGYTTAKELLTHYPRAYATHNDTPFLNQANDGDIVTCIGEIIHTATIHTKRTTTIYTITIQTTNELIKATFFHTKPHQAAWCERTLTRGTTAIFTGKIKTYRGAPQLQHPDFLLLNTPHPTSTGALKQLTAYGNDTDISNFLTSLPAIPIYPARQRITTWRILGAIHHILSHTNPIPDPLGPFTPPDLPTFDRALRGIHQDGTNAYTYRHRLAYNEALALALVMEIRRHDTTPRHATPLSPHPTGAPHHRESLINNLPYTLTTGQQTIINTIATDLNSPHPMQRLLQGEVGSGKTIIALIAMLQAVENGKQCALLAPTSVLAHQHGHSLTELLTNAGINLTITTLTGDMTPTQKNHALLAIISGDANIIIGTHALIQDTVEFFDLGLVIIDEQHRFGVEQRDSLRTKGKNHTTPHLLVMTATPIPRTIAMTFFGDLNHSTLSELPGGRRPIKSYVVPEYLPKYTTRAYEVMREHIHQGHQIYIVCPRINGPGGVLETHQHLSETEFKNYRIGLLHGQLKDADKDTTMRQFANGDLDILIATTVIEVGIDVPNATIIMIRESENLGVSQLHQLRGRVGRGGYDSICFFHHTAERGTPADKRIWQMAATTDGFQVAEIDLIQRHEGDVLGTSQSGTNRKIAFLNLARDIGLITRANRDAKNIVAHNLDLARQLIAGIDDITQDYLDKS